MGLLNFLLDTEWPLVFIAFYLFFLAWVIIKSNRQWKALGAEIQKNEQNPHTCFVLLSRYLKSNPFSQMNSTVRLMAIPILLQLNDVAQLRIYVKKIRAVDIMSGSADYLMFALFLLKENGYEFEYNLLKEKCQKSYKECKTNLFQNLMGETIDVDRLPEAEELPVTQFKFTRALIAYYKGLDFLQNQEQEKAQVQFALAQEVLPNIKTFLNKKGYAV